MDKIYLEENMTYEVLITTKDNTKINTKPFGIRYKNNQIILNLFPNKTLENIKKNNEFIIQFTQNPLIYTKALLGQLKSDDYQDENILKDATYIIKAKATSITKKKQEDKYGKNIITTIKSEIISTKEIHPQISVINRATNKLIDLLVEYTRLNYTNKNHKIEYIKKLDDLQKFIIKTGNKNHIDSINLLKKEIEE